MLLPLRADFFVTLQYEIPCIWYIDFKLLKCCQPKRQVTIDFSMAFCTLPLTVSILSKTQCSRSIFNSGFSFLAPFCSRSFLKVAQILAQLANVMAQNSSTSVQSLRRDHLVYFKHSGPLPHNSKPETSSIETYYKKAESNRYVSQRGFVVMVHQLPLQSKM